MLHTMHLLVKPCCFHGLARCSCRHMTQSSPVRSIKSACVTIETVDSCVLFSSKWLLNQLIIPIRMLYKCVHIKFGTVLYHRGADLLVSLSWALGANSLSEDTSVQHHTSTTKQIDKSSVLHNAAYVVNDLISVGNLPQENIAHYHLT